MDNITHSLVGAAIGQSLLKKKYKWSGLWAGLASNAADLDVLIKSEADPLLALEYHRHFTHALAFVPFLSVVIFIPLLVFPHVRKNWSYVFLSVFIGYLVHAPIDLVTSYGTQFLLPFSHDRLSLDWIAIIDLFFTIPLLVGVSYTAFTHNLRGAYFAVSWIFIFLSFGAFQHSRALQAQQKIIEARGHKVEHRRVMPTMTNLVVWRSIYRTEDTIYSDAIRTPFLKPSQILKGEVRTLYTKGALSEELTKIENTQLRKRFKEDFDRFHWFSDGFVSLSGPLTFQDDRYSLDTEKFVPLWGVQFDPTSHTPVKRVSFVRIKDRDLKSLLNATINPVGFIDIDKFYESK